MKYLVNIYIKFYIKSNDFKSNGTLTETIYEDNKGSDTYSGTYTYHHPELKIRWNDDDEIEIYTVVSVSSSSLELKDEYGDTEIYRKK